MENYRNEINVSASPESVYQALTKFIPKWWSAHFEGASDKEGSTYTVRFGDSIYKTFEVTQLQPDKKVVWVVRDSVIDIPELKNKTEWIGTIINWEIEDTNNSTLLKLTHIGLTRDVECYDICEAGWTQFINSLKAFAETGEGVPFKT
ncbi:SRPBCC family protein [Chryseobacterium aquaticum]|uniref:Activator of Hsp90 ATPase homologue 1/2-like C-terminal domain-containing protein n=1 Tax=Chryseobacterium aquaticum subsp. greenlandense TaxID=345663 RepID=A0A117KBM6_9FLAO|nr:SRPBCC domain-containing protein [Chryseobacterium aquaticum]KUJ56145.1 hypothetical protein AR686_11135 [Chryseobacterium aquaticum subsp. greenlandense]